MTRNNSSTASLIAAAILFSVSCSDRGGPVNPTAPTRPAPGVAAVGAGAPIISQVPGEDGGPPFYTPVFSDGSTPGVGFVPTDGVWVGIHWYRQPSCVPEGFNLLKVFDPPAAWDCGLAVRGQVWRHDAGDRVPFQEHYSEAEAVPIYFVLLSELGEATVDKALTLGELEALPSMLVGRADWYRGVIHNTTQAGTHGHETLTARGQLEDGRSFHFHFVEKFQNGQHTFQNVEIEFH